MDTSGDQFTVKAGEEIVMVHREGTGINKGLIPDVTRFSDWKRLRNATAYAIKFYLKGKFKTTTYPSIYESL